MKYFIGAADLDWSDSRWFYKGGTGHEPERREGFVGLFDRNTRSFQWFKIVEICMNRLGWIVESDIPPADYWAKQIQHV